LVIASSMSASVGSGFAASSAAAAMIMPLWQKPHCGTSSATHALLQRMRARGRQLLDGDDFLRRLDRRDGTDAAARRHAVDVNRASAALRDAATVLRAGQSDLLAQHPQTGGVSGSTSKSYALPLTFKVPWFPVLQKRIRRSICSGTVSPDVLQKRRRRCGARYAWHARSSQHPERPDGSPRPIAQAASRKGASRLSSRSNERRRLRAHGVTRNRLRAAEHRPSAVERTVGREVREIEHRRAEAAVFPVDEPQALAVVE
jgi:hypothetical protein